MNLNYITNIPNGPNNPSTDQPNMQINTNSINTWPTVDHFGFNDNNGGFHLKSTYVSNILSLGTPPTTIAGQVALYAANTTPGNILAYVRDAGSTGIALTNANDPRTTTGSVGIGTYNYMTSFLPGGFILQSGKVSAPSSSNPVVFPITFPNAIFSIQVSLLVDAGTSTTSKSVSVTTSSLSGFSFKPEVSLSSSTANFLFWTAIGN